MEQNKVEINNRDIVTAIIRGLKLTVRLLEKLLKGEKI
jgi:hypothetical protein